MTRRQLATIGLVSAVALLAGCAAAGPSGTLPAQGVLPSGSAPSGIAGQPATAGSEFAAAPTTPAVWATPGSDPAHGSGVPTGDPPSPAGRARDVSAGHPFTPLTVVLPSGRVVPVRPAQVAADGSLVVPADPGQLGWWTGGARPGDPFGSVVLAGHIDSQAYGIGALAELVHARLGQPITVRAGASAQTSLLTYRITARLEVPKAGLASGTDAFRQDVPGRLVLITCGGPYDAARHSYRDNLIVVASPTA